MTSMANDKFWNLLAKKLSGEASEIELKELEMLLENPSLKTLSETLSSIWHQSVPVDNNESLQALEHHIQRMKEKKIEFGDLHQDETSHKQGGIIMRLIRKRWLLPVSSIAAAALLFFIIRNNNKDAEKNQNIAHPVSQVTTRPGSRTQLRLPDGTTVWLNASSNLTYDENFGKELREVNLVGEAFFDVVKDPSRPFIIHTKTINVKVLGTEFNVKAYPDDSFTETSLIRGSVEVTIKSRPNEKHFLKPNEKMVVANDLPAEMPIKKEKEIKPLVTTEALTFDSTENAIVETSWINNRLIFHQNETFAEMAPKLERWYGVHINFENEKAANEYKPFVSFTNETITQALNILQLAYKFNYKIDGNEITITQ